MTSIVQTTMLKARSVIHLFTDLRLDPIFVLQVREFVNSVRIQSARYRSNHVMLTLGGDFQYIAAHVNFKNIDKLIK